MTALAFFSFYFIRKSEQKNDSRVREEKFDVFPAPGAGIGQFTQGVTPERRAGHLVIAQLS